MQTELEQFVVSRMGEVREGLDIIQSILLGAKYPGWRDDLAGETDQFHIAVHRVIGLFELSQTPASELAGHTTPEEDAQWSRFDNEF